MALGSLGYVVNDAFIRRTTENGPDIYQVLFLRSIGLACVFAVVGGLRHERTTRVHLQPAVLRRVAAELVATTLFFAALVHLEFANAQAILQIVPFAVTLAAAVVVRESVSAGQYATVILGFLGVLIVMRPATDGFSAWSLMVVGSAAFMVVRELATREVCGQIPATSIAFVTASGLAMLTGVISVFSGWRHLSIESALLIGLSIGSLFFGYLFTIQTVRIGDLSISAPFRYSLLLGAVVLGYVLFDEVPDGLTILGSIVIVFSGIAAVAIERQRRSGARIVTEQSVGL